MYTVREKIHVRWNPQYKASATKTIITGYLVYAYIGNPLLGKIRGSEQVVKTEYQAKKLAAKMRKEIHW